MTDDRDAERFRWIADCHKEKRLAQTQAILWNNSSAKAIRKAVDEAIRAAKEGE